MNKIYLAGDIFTESAQQYSFKVANAIKMAIPDVEIYNPCENMDINDKTNYTSGIKILMADYRHIKESDALVCIADSMDHGMLVEIGIAWERGIPIYQVYTDSRLSGADSFEKLQSLHNNVFNNTYLYLNQLVTATSQVDKDGQGVYRLSKSIDNLVTQIKWDIEDGYYTKKGGL